MYGAGGEEEQEARRRRRAAAAGPLAELEARAPVPALDHPLVKLAPFAVGGTIPLAGANMGYLRQMDQYEAEEAKWGKGKDKWGRQVPRELRGVPHDWSPQKVAVRALGIGTLVAGIVGVCLTLPTLFAGEPSMIAFAAVLIGFAVLFLIYSVQRHRKAWEAESQSISAEELEAVEEMQASADGGAEEEENEDEEYLNLLAKTPRTLALGAG